MITQLPQALVQSILAFAEREYDVRSHFPISERAQVAFRLTGYSLVSKEWYGLINDFRSQQALGNLTITIVNGTRKEFVNHRRRILLMRHALRHVKIIAPTNRSPHPMVYPWSSLLIDMPHVHSLNLMEFSPTNAGLIDIVKAASVHCRQLRSLQLPILSPPIPHHTLEWTSITSAVLDGIKEWHIKGQCHGLRQLVLPARDRSTRVPNLAQTTYFIDQICQHCPLIEEVAVGTLPNGFDDVYHRTEPWIITPTTFESFCRSCPFLTVFNWSVVPFATVYFEVFGRYVKPNLTKLILTSADIWSSDERMQCMAREEYEQGDGKTAKNVQVILRACPALRELEIVHEATFVDGYEMNMELYGNQFFKTLVQSCPMISSITIDADTRPIMSFNNNSLVALGTLPCLTYLQLPSVNITAKGLFMLLKNVPNEYLASREYKVTIGTNATGKNSTLLMFYETILELLRRLNKCKVPLGCFHRKLTLEIINGHTSDVSYSFSDNYMRQLIPLIKQFQIKYANRLLLQMETIHMSDTLVDFSRINTCMISTWSDTTDIRVEDVFIHVEDDDDEEDDMYDDRYEDYDYEDYHGYFDYDSDYGDLDYEMDDDLYDYYS